MIPPPDQTQVLVLLILTLQMKKDLIRQLLKADVEIRATESFSEDVCSCLKRLKVPEEQTWLQVKGQSRHGCRSKVKADMAAGQRSKL